MTTETKIIFYLLSSRFRACYPHMIKEINWKNIDFSCLLEKAARNRVVYSFACKALEEEIAFDLMFGEILQEIIKEGNKRKEELKKTVKIIKESWDGKVDYYLFKTKQTTDSLPSDLDILFKNKKDYQTAINLMEKLGFSYHGGPLKGALISQDLLPVEPHLTVSWGGREFFSKNFLFRKPQTTSFLGFQFKTLNYEAKLGVRLAQIFFDCQYLIIKDFLTIKRLLEIVKDVQEIRKEAVLYGWTEAFEKGLSLVQLFDQIVFEDGQNVVREIDFPFWLPPQLYLKAFTKKAIFDYKKRVKGNLKEELFMLLAYCWKRIRYFFPKSSYFVHSWLY